MKDKVKETLSNILAYLLKVERRTLLWTNPSPGSDFASQQVALSLNDYDEVEIVYVDYKLYSDVPPRLRIPLNQYGSMIALFGGSTYETGVPFFATRKAVAYPTYILFGQGNGSHPTLNWTVRNDMCIPWKIYGINQGGGTT